MFYCVIHRRVKSLLIRLFQVDIILLKNDRSVIVLIITAFSWPLDLIKTTVIVPFSAATSRLKWSLHNTTCFNSWVLWLIWEMDEEITSAKSGTKLLHKYNAKAQKLVKTMDKTRSGFITKQLAWLKTSGHCLRDKKSAIIIKQYYSAIVLVRTYIISETSRANATYKSFSVPLYFTFDAWI